MSLLRFENIVKSYEQEIVIDELSLTIEKGEFLTILGASGCGKTILLKMVNRLVTPDKGKIFFNDKPLDSWDVIDLRRRVGYVIQQIGLFPHMSVQDNISFVVSLENKDKIFQKKRAQELIELVGLDGRMLSRRPRELSGGQQQRVGVARALASDPEVVLMDEPFGAVDEIARAKLQKEIQEIHKKLHKTILFVTHDIQEALDLGTKIVLMDKGKISQIGTKEELVFKPQNDFVKSFLGEKGLKAVMSSEHLEDIYRKEAKKFLQK